jgi:hypothetical protein
MLRGQVSRGASVARANVRGVSVARATVWCAPVVLPLICTLNILSKNNGTINIYDYVYV